MSCQRNIDEYKESENINEIFEQGYFSFEISGYFARIIQNTLKTPLFYFYNYFFKNLNTLTILQNLEIQDEPTEIPLHTKTFSECDFGENIDIMDLIKKNQWPYTTIGDYYFAYMEGKVTPSYVAEKILKICQSDTIKNYKAIAEMIPEEIFSRADKSTERYKNKKPLSVVDGVPFFVKECIKIKNYKTFGGIFKYQKVRKNTAECVQKLIDAGAMLMGTTTMVECGANAIGINVTDEFPSCLNPWDSSRYTGGSSSGNGVLVSLGICPFTLGTDALGSIRVPSAWCGCVGLRPTFDRISMKGIKKKTSKNAFSVVGPMACSVNDAAIVLQIIGDKIKDDTKPLILYPIFHKFDIKNIKFGFYRKYIEFSENNQIVCFNKFCEFLKTKECKVEEIVIPEIVEIVTAAMRGCITGIKGIVSHIEKKYGVFDLKSISLNLMNIVSQNISDEEIVKINKQRTRAMKIVEILFKDIDVLLILTTSRFPYTQSASHKNYGFWDNDSFNHANNYSCLASLTGIPALSINIGYDQNTGLPISLQLLSKWWREDFLFSVGNLIEENFPCKIPKDFQKIL